jgi:hypothetical protein
VVRAEQRRSGACVERARPLGARQAGERDGGVACAPRRPRQALTVPDHRRRSFLPDRALLPPAPRDPALARRWEALPFEERRRLAVAATTGVPDHGGTDLAGDDTRDLPEGVDGRDGRDGHGSHDGRDGRDGHRGHVHDGHDGELVGALAAARVATGWRLQVAAVVLGWLVLMTVWGFGRSTFPADEDRWLVAGAIVGALAWALAAGSARRRVRRAAAVAARHRRG